MKKKKKTEKKQDTMSKRLGIVIALCLAMFVVVVIRLVWINVVDGKRYSQAAKSQTESSAVTLSAKRGDIVDRNGIQLATSTVVYELILDPALILTNPDRYLEPTIAALVEHFGFLDGVSDSELRETINERSSSHYVVLGRNLTYAQIEGFIAAKEENSKIAGVFTNESYKRNYAFGTLASSVLGFTSNGAGIYGIEYEYDEELTGIDGREYTYVNSDNVVETVRKEAENGYTAKLTIDYNIQSIVETKIKEFLVENESQTVAVIIQDPNTGAILAMDDSDNFDCNEPYNFELVYTDEQIEEMFALTNYYEEEEIAAMSDEELEEAEQIVQVNARSEVWKNFCITQSYEPGSTFKPFTLAAGLEEARVKMDDTYLCYGSLEFLQEVVQCHITSGHGELDTTGAIQESCNVALMEMSEKIGPSLFVKYQNKFGFGKYTDIDLPNEMSCENLLYDETMSELDLATNSFGQNFNTTMIQLSTGFCSLINGGYLYRPYIVEGLYNDEQELVKSYSRTLVAKTISEDTSDTIKTALRHVVSEGTGIAAACDGYVVSGKTGTAEKLGREDGIYLISFIGFAPYDNPEVLCYVVIDEPSTGDQSHVASGLFHSIMEEVLPYMNVTPASEDYDPVASETEEATTVEP